MRAPFTGSMPALITPFRDGRVDEDALAALVDWQIAQGSRALVPCGTTGESATLSIAEHDHVVALVVQAAAGRVPVIAGCGSNDTAVAIHHVERAAAAGAAAALVVCPYYNRPGQRGLLSHFLAVAERSPIPILIYNIPARTGIDMTTETMAELARHPRIVGVKESTGDIGRISEIRHECGHDFLILSGNDYMTLGIIAHGGHGAISVTANVAPDLNARLVDAALAGDFATALALQDQLWPLHVALFSDPSPGPVKYALARLGRCRPDVRLPVPEPSPAARAQVDAALAHAGIAP
ncbi:MAG: 4-hydroxy-tetrahydrodipicolinate synthase [Sphingomonadaceae bacterium]|uniref:4-hydroxy-tetrahydrodipicolinate synthase n=1 Tax=Thermaurantiacus sp. TaxID=2820283 RepID=UPI00298F0727|nr:4-hydroxy-tetrahydrodipicolinate synthase [Thermaurantiacus sp.]MCS6986468.1 4-hydroxy-tetrahydrodipicolinate synthase [Sphingomonadaceae bacterium]MDW8414271.1 4-hydroxy-tetrahydrodipicolinate synthase [Thermaurantiacus sp.]